MELNTLYKTQYYFCVIVQEDQISIYLTHHVKYIASINHVLMVFRSFDPVIQEQLVAPTLQLIEKVLSCTKKLLLSYVCKKNCRNNTMANSFY